MPRSRTPAPRSRGRRVTQADVAREAGVSRGLVSLALSGSELVSAASRERIAAAARHLGYRADASAASLASGRSGMVGLVLPDLRNPFFDFLAQALQEAARERGLTVLISLAADDGGRAAADTLLGLRVEGLVLVSPALGEATIRALGRDVPVCVVGHADVGGCVDTVRLDEAAAAETVVEHLVGAGARRLVYLAPLAEEDPNAFERGEALAGAARGAGLTLETVVDDSQGSSALRRALWAAQGRGPAGVVAHNDVVALDALAVLGRQDRWVPLVSYDNTFLARREEFSLTSVEQPVSEMARDAVSLLCQRSGREAPGGGGSGEGRLGGGGLGEETSESGAAEGEVPAPHGAFAMPARHVTVPPVLAVRRSSSPRDRA